MKRKLINKYFGMKSFVITTFILIIVFYISCRKQDYISNEVLANYASKLIEQEDSIDLVSSIELQNNFKKKIRADIETEPVESEYEEDAADDPAIWVNIKDPTKSLILGTNKRGGIYVYNLQGRKIQYREIGRVNNVDLRDGFYYKGKEVVIVAGSNRTNNSISLLYIDKEDGSLSDTITNIKSGVDEVYGICFFKNLVLNRFYVFVNGKGGLVEQYYINFDKNFTVNKVRNFSVSSQPEAMAVSDKNSMLYIGVEHEGIYKTSANPYGNYELLKIPASDSTNSNISYDIEGIAVFSYKNIEYLIASSQGNFSYAIFKLGVKEKYITSFILSGGKIDGVEETDGIEVTTATLNIDFPMGLLVVQDGYNFEKDSLINQNFKYISLEKVLKLIK